jgi:hypothetical protein
MHLAVAWNRSLPVDAGRPRRVGVLRTRIDCRGRRERRPGSSVDSPVRRGRMDQARRFLPVGRERRQSLRLLEFDDRRLESLKFRPKSFRPIGRSERRGGGFSNLRCWVAKGEESCHRAALSGARLPAVVRSGPRVGRVALPVPPRAVRLGSRRRWRLSRTHYTAHAGAVGAIALSVGDSWSDLPPRPTPPTPCPP